MFGLNWRSAQLNLGAASLNTLCRLAAQGMRLTFLPETTLHQETASAAGLTPLLFLHPQPARQVLMIQRNTTPTDSWFDE